MTRSKLFVQKKISIPSELKRIEFTLKCTKDLYCEEKCQTKKNVDKLSQIDASHAERKKFIMPLL